MEDDEKYIESLRLQNKQQAVNEMFEEEGLTDEILIEQVELNKKRHECDVHDPNEETYEKYVQ